jgi:hypothetical protein
VLLIPARPLDEVLMAASAPGALVHDVLDHPLPVAKVAWQF